MDETDSISANSNEINKKIDGTGDTMQHNLLNK